MGCSKIIMRRKNDNPVWIQYQKCTQTVSNIFKYYTSPFSLLFLGGWGGGGGCFWSGEQEVSQCPLGRKKRVTISESILSSSVPTFLSGGGGGRTLPSCDRGRPLLGCCCFGLAFGLGSALGLAVAEVAVCIIKVTVAV